MDLTDPRNTEELTEQELLAVTLAELHDVWTEANLANWAGDREKVLLALVDLVDLATAAVEAANERKLAGQA